MFQNDPMLWSYSAQAREQALLHEANDYRQTQRAEGKPPTQLKQGKLWAAVVTAVPIIALIAWVLVSG